MANKEKELTPEQIRILRRNHMDPALPSSGSGHTAPSVVIIQTAAHKKQFSLVP